MQFLNLTLYSAADNLALDEALLLEAEAGQSDELLRVWEWPNPAVVLGSGCKLMDDVKEAACIRDGVVPGGCCQQVHRRERAVGSRRARR